MSDGRLDVTYYGMRPATRADWDALRAERDAWKARAERLVEQLRIATEQLQAFSDQRQERYPGEMGTFAHDALIRISVVEGPWTLDGELIVELRMTSQPTGPRLGPGFEKVGEPL